LPGIAFHSSFDKLSGSKITRCRAASELMEAYENYRSDTIFESEHTYFAFTAFDNYPRIRIADDNLLIFVEGAIYGEAEDLLRSKLVSIGKQLLCWNGSDDLDFLKNWLVDCDGEFVAVFINTSNSEVFIVNDALGRLPLFYMITPTGISVSREQKFIIEVNDHNKPDRLSIAEYLVFGYNTGGRTMVENIHRLDPATLIRVDPEKETVRIDPIHKWILGESDTIDSDLKDCSIQTANLFQKLVIDRINAFPEHTPVLGLSGGLDSRVLLVSLLKSGVPFSSHTNQDANHGSASDMIAARRLVDVMKCDWRPYMIGEEPLEAFHEIVRNQEGGSSSVMAVAVENYRLLTEDFGSKILYFTGNGGNTIMAGFMVTDKLKSLDDLYSMTASSAYEFPVSTACKLAGIDSSDFEDAIRKTLAEYPEQDCNAKFSHHRLFGRSFRFTMSGEDRSRFHFWIATPFWNVDLLKLSMSMPDKYKARFSLYVEVLRHLDPKSLTTPYSNVGARPDSFLASCYDLGRSVVTRNKTLYRLIRQMTASKSKREVHSTVLDNSLNEIMKNSEMLPETLDIDYLRTLLSGRLTRIKYHLLSTVILNIHNSENHFVRPK